MTDSKGWITRDLKPVFTKYWGPLTLLSLLLPLAVFQPGCGASSLERHTMAAGILHAVADESAAVIEAEARTAADAAVEPCVSGQEPRETCEAALAEAMRPRRRAAAVQRLYAAAVDGYVLAVLTAARDESPDLTLAVRALGRVLGGADEWRALLAEYGTTLPDPGPVVRALLGGGR